MKKNRVVVAMSGGVDSSVAAFLLKEKGYDIIGITLQLMPSSAKTVSGSCCNINDIEDARMTADKLKIPHYVLNFRDLFKEKVIDDFINQYMLGKTPNPCIRCNQYIKFSGLFKKAMELDAKYIATGHYARVIRNKKSFFLKKGADEKKDQSYVLYMLSQNHLSKVLFPLGGLKKEEVRAIAKKNKFHISEKKESQEICFIPDNDYVSFLKNASGAVMETGNIRDINGKIIGKHKGIPSYTIGQRRNIGLSSKKPLYVLSINHEKNEITVGENKDLYSKGLIAGNVNYIVENTDEYDIIHVKIRYSAPGIPAELSQTSGGKVKVIFREAQRAVAPGQGAVFYHKDLVLGGGTIEKSIIR